MLEIDERTILEDVCEHFQEVIDEALANPEYSGKLMDLFHDYIGDDCLSTVLKYPEAFKAFEEHGFIPWKACVLDIEGNIGRLIGAGYDRSDILHTVAYDIFSGTPYLGELTEDFVRLYEEYGPDRIKEIVTTNHPSIDSAYIDEIVDNIAEMCDGVDIDDDDE